MKGGIMPRMLLTEFDVLVSDASEQMNKEGENIGDVSERVEIFIREITDRIGERLDLDENQTPIKDDAKFVGIMAIGLLVVGLFIAISSKILGRSDKRSSRLYRFPDVLVGERLGAPNGGGKVSFTDFGSSFSSGR
ncbi:hypothetical protein N9E90_02765 [Akkermansiaceae bacterium]|nr:hypothetical protein [Akkermansiaceae bacterium]